MNILKDGETGNKLSESDREMERSREERKSRVK